MTMANLRKSMSKTPHFQTLICSFSSQSAKPDPFDFFSNFAAKPDDNSFETADDLENRLFGSTPRDSSPSGSFLRKIDRIDRARGSVRGPNGGFGSGFGSRSGMYGGGFGGGGGGGLVEGFDSLLDGMDEKLKKAATAFPTTGEIYDEDYAFRPDVRFEQGMTYTPRDLDLTKPVQKNITRRQFETTTEEVLKKADFRNVRFLANFLTEAGIIIKRSQTKISAKAQRKVAREIKTARFLGLMPFTTMGSKRFNFGRPAQDVDADYEYDSYYDGTTPEADVEPEELS